ncbi:DUF4326 domain-containing protein [Methylomonas sp. HYX-M1]|uniref:DUF4326 domain-containing protein n=1 Tax=Methylomonas sp. HYX-M1 TaxID=3139307 RepID=UPI00345C51FE
MPGRVQLRRSKGWRMPPNTVKVDRTTRWGNPYVGSGQHDREQMTRLFAEYCARPEQADFVAAVCTELRGKNLACWCPLDGPCHADVLILLANAP